MQTNESKSQYAILKHRFESLMISTSKANSLVGKTSPGIVRYEESEQGSARRKLLNVEKVAIEDRKLQEINDESYVDSVRNEFHQILLTHFDKEICDTSTQYYNVLGLTDTMPALLDMLAIKASSIARLEPLAARVPWIYDELMKVVNAPQHRRKDSRGKVIVVETLRTALSFINIDNLKLLIPALAFRRTIPQVTDPYPQIKSRAWQYNLGVALTARQLAPMVGVRENDAYVLGILQGLGCNAITRLYFRLFERLQREELEKAQREKKRDRHDALTKITPSCNFLLALWSDFGDEIAAHFIHHMEMQRVFIGDAADAIANKLTADNAMAKLIEQSRIYSQFRMLNAHRLLDKEEAKVMLRASRLPISEIERLKNINITTLPLVMKAELDIDE
jgi:hypothetical protein